MLTGFLLAAWQWGDWRHWRRYYPTQLFVATVNIAAGYLTYQHPLWDFNADALVSSETVVELINSFVVMPATVLVYLSNFPAGGRVRQGRYVLAWVMLFAAIEAGDTLVGGISYFNGWSLAHSIVFDGLMFSLIRLHQTRPLQAWLATLAAAAYILAAYGFFTGEMK